MTELDTLTAEEQNRKQGAPRGQKRPFRPREVWAIRARLEMLGEYQEKLKAFEDKKKNKK